MLQYSSGVHGDRHHLVDVPLASDGNVSLVNITISQRPDGSDWLLGKGSSGKVTSTNAHRSPLSICRVLLYLSMLTVNV